MLKKLRMEHFKGFRDAELSLGPFTVLVGANGSGKTNVREAFRFLHGVSRGYSLAEIMGEKWVEGGELVWRGIRGGTREATFHGAATFALEVELTLEDGALARTGAAHWDVARYRIEVDVGDEGRSPFIVAEHLKVGHPAKYGFETLGVGGLGREKPTQITARLIKPTPGRPPQRAFDATRPLLGQIPANAEVNQPRTRHFCREALRALNSMRFLDLALDAMRRPSFPGQTILGDRGENLSTVLQAIYQRSDGKQLLTEWINALTPMDVKDLEFSSDQIGRVLLTLVEHDERRTSAFSASDGTLRFLAMIAALLGPDPARFYFLEELENGIHANRLDLLLQLIEQRVGDGAIQVVATTHSPQLLRLVSPTTLESVSLAYRLEGHAQAEIIRVLDLPDARQVLQSADLARLHESGWLENVAAFREVEPISA